MSIDRLVEWIKMEEGFSDVPYKDSLGHITFGHGLTNITYDESVMLVKNRLDKFSEFVDQKLDHMGISIDGFRRDVLIDMCYQLGTAGICCFVKMWEALKNMDYDEAADQMLDSLWKDQTPNRCKLLAERMRNGYDRQRDG